MDDKATCPVETTLDLIGGKYKALILWHLAGKKLRFSELRRVIREQKPDLIPCNAGTAYSEAVNVLTSGRKVIEAIWDGTDWIGPFRFWDAEGEEITHWTPVLLPLPEPLEDGTA